MIQTESGYFAQFEPTQQWLDEAYFNVQDTLSTANGGIMLATAVLVLLGSFLFYYNAYRAPGSRDSFCALSRWPLLLTGAALLATALFVVFSLARGKKELFSRVVPALGLMVGAALAAAMLIERPDSGEWDPRPALNWGDPGTVAGALAVGLSLVALFTNYLSSVLRVDRMQFMGTGYLSFVVCCFAACVGMFYMSSLIMDVVRDLEGAAYLAAYLGLLFFLFLALTAGDGLVVRLSQLVSGPDYQYLAVSPEVANATSRTKQTLVAVACLVVFGGGLLPLAMGARPRGAAAEPTNAFFVAAGLVALAVPALSLLAQGALQLRLRAPDAYYVLSNVVLHGVFFAVGAFFVAWTETTVRAAFAFCCVLFLLYMTSSNVGSNLTLSLVSAALFILVKEAARLNLAEDGSDLEYVVFAGLPLLVFTGLWFGRALYTKSDYAYPLCLLAFSATFVASRAAARQAVPDPTALGLDFVTLATVFGLLSAFAYLVKDQVETFEIRHRVRTGAVQALALIVVGCLGGVGYVAFGRNQDVREVLETAQERARGLFSRVLEDVNGSTRWV